MTPDEIHEHDLLRTLAATAHSDAYPQPKKAAGANGVTVRTARRWRTPTDAKGSPQYRRSEEFDRYLRSAAHPFRLLAMDVVTVKRATIKEWSTERLIAEYREVRARDKVNEAADANAEHDAESWTERAIATERDLADDMLKAAIEREFAVRRVPMEDVR